MNKRIMTFISQNWIFIVFLLMLVYILLHSQREISSYKKEIKKYKERIINLEEQIQIDLHVIDSLSKYDTIYVQQIKVIKEKANETIKYVDTMSVSDMQSFYSKRYKN